MEDNVIRIDGKEIELSEETVESFKKQFGIKKEETYCVGEIVIANVNDKYQLVMIVETGEFIEREVTLLRMEEGRFGEVVYWNKTTKVDNVACITQEEINKYSSEINVRKSDKRIVLE